MEKWMSVEIGTVGKLRVSKATSPTGTTGLTLAALKKDGKPYKAIFVPNPTPEEIRQLSHLISQYTER